MRTIRACPAFVVRNDPSKGCLMDKPLQIHMICAKLVNQLLVIHLLVSLMLCVGVWCVGLWLVGKSFCGNPVVGDLVACMSYVDLLTSGMLKIQNPKTRNPKIQKSGNPEIQKS